MEYIITSVESAECEVLCSGIKSSGSIDVFIPSTVEINQKIYNVTSIDVDAFRECTSLTRVEIPSGVTSIGEYAFYGCSSLTSIEIPSSITSIDSGTFSGCSNLSSVTFVENSQLTSIGRSAFYGCSSLTSIEIPSGVTSIGDYAFRKCTSLTRVEIPSSITSIGGSAFAGCTSLTSIICYAENIPSTGSDIFSECPASMIINVYANSLDLYKTSSQWNDFTIEPIIAYIVDYGDYSLKYAIKSASDKECEVLLGATSGSRLVISIPSTVEINQNTYDVTSVGDNAFRDCSSLYAIDVPSCITSIGDEAFSNSSLKLISFGENSQLVFRNPKQPKSTRNNQT